MTILDLEIRRFIVIMGELIETGRYSPIPFKRKCIELDKEIKENHDSIEEVEYSVTLYCEEIDKTWEVISGIDLGFGIEENEIEKRIEEEINERLKDSGYQVKVRRIEMNESYEPLTRVKRINEVLALYKDGKFDFADFDVEGLYDLPKKEFHVISPEEVKAVRDYLNIDEIETEDELRAVRNTIVKYCADKSSTMRKESEELSKKWHEENPDGTFEEFMKQNPYDIMWDKMSAYTHVIDMELYKRFGHD